MDTFLVAGHISANVSALVNALHRGIERGFSFVYGHVLETSVPVYCVEAYKEDYCYFCRGMLLLLGYVRGLLLSFFFFEMYCLETYKEDFWEWVPAPSLASSLK